MAQKKEKISFGKSLEELEKITVELESGDIGLEESMQKFEKGLIVAEKLKKYLNETENTITTMKKKFDVD